MPNVGADAAHIYGITPIDVFNKTDLAMAENWFVLKSVDFREDVPLFAEDGSRLRMHASDRIYFGNTLRFRREVIGKDGCHFEQYTPMLEYLSRIYLQMRAAPEGDHAFTYRQFHQPLVSAADIRANRFVPAPIQAVCEVEYVVARQE